MKVYCLCFENSGGVWKIEQDFKSVEMTLCKEQSACEAMGPGGMSPGNFKVLVSNKVVCFVHLHIPSV